MDSLVETVCVCLYVDNIMYVHYVAGSLYTCECGCMMIRLCVRPLYESLRETSPVFLLLHLHLCIPGSERENHRKRERALCVRKVAPHVL